MTIKGTKQDDDLSGTTGDDVFNMAQGGDDTVMGGRGDDTFLYGKRLTAADRIDGGNGIDTLVVGGDYTGANALVFAGDTMTRIEIIQFRAGSSYDFTFARLTGVENFLFTFDGHSLGAGDSLTLNASASTFIDLTFIGGAGDDVLTGGSRVNLFDLSRGGSDTATGGERVDTFQMGAALDASDRLDGAESQDTVNLKGRYGDPGTASPVILADDTLKSIEVVTLSGSFDYALKFADGNLAAGATLKLDASAVDVSHAVYLDASAETDGTYVMIAGAGDNTFIGGAKGDGFTFHGDFGPGDFVDGGAGFDTLVLGQASGLVLPAANIVSIEDFEFSGASDVTLTGAMPEIHLDGSATTSFTADLSAANVSQILFFKGGAGDDVLVLGAGSAPPILSIDGGQGLDTVRFDAPALTLDLDFDFRSFETFVLEGATSTYTVKLETGFGANSDTITVDASALSDASSSLYLDASRQSSTFTHLTGGAGDDVITGSANFDTIDGGAGDDTIAGGGQGDTLTGGSGSDVFVYKDGVDSYAHFLGYDAITDFDAAEDFIKMPFQVAYDGETTGNVTRPATQLAQIVNPLMTVDGAVLVEVTGGKLMGHLLLAIDSNHDGQYTTDYLIDLTGMTNAASFGSADFIT